jgi:hypothetical protein
MLPSHASMLQREDVYGANWRMRAGGSWEADDATSDLAHGQVVIIAARWILTLAGLLLALWNPGSVGELRVQILVILILAVSNFYLHAQVLRRRPILDTVAYGASAADLAVVTLLVVANGGFESDLYIFYFPAILALSVAFPTLMTLAFAGGAIALYVPVALLSPGTATESGLQALLVRVLMLAAVAVCGNTYWRIEGERRQAAVEAQEALAA